MDAPLCGYKSATHIACDQPSLYRAAGAWFCEAHRCKFCPDDRALKITNGQAESSGKCGPCYRAVIATSRRITCSFIHSDDARCSLPAGYYSGTGMARPFCDLHRCKHCEDGVPRKIHNKHGADGRCAVCEKKERPSKHRRAVWYKFVTKDWKPVQGIKA
jgi:hypothetical protein